MGMKVLVVGGGGREHAIATALSRTGDVTINSVMAKRNPGISRIAKEILIHRETDVPRVLDFARKTGSDYAVIGPEAPLETGIVDALEGAGIACTGPSRAAARLETDKGFCREMMDRHGIAGCPRYRVCHSVEEAISFMDEYGGDLAIKPIGLTGGKGVRIMGEQVDYDGAVDYIRKIDGHVVLEERLVGEEFTLQAFADGKNLVPMPLVQDHKRAFEGDTGPNTGGMGSYSMPDHMLPFVTTEDYEKALTIMKSVLGVMKRDGHPYKGILYGQFMNTAEGPKVIEFNARFGDPEAMNVLTLLSSDFTDIVTGISEGTLSSARVRFSPAATVCKYIVPKGYPDTPNAGDPISLGEMPGSVILYYANVEERQGQLVTLTSRTLAFVGIGRTLAEAEKTAETAASSVTGNVRHRRDIGTEKLLAQRCDHMKALR
ncbi:MAG: phosphoribosylamine--glycine ligase [Methanoregula sp. PtaU1.Bin051]|nr:MAG: phosphoribosylamine--glycine ligase [Methanoregula sp. PtaU1.Bin051]